MGHGNEHGHGDGHGAAQAHDLAHAASSGPHEIPPAPVCRYITPAPEDFATAPAPHRLLWPVAWAVVVVVLVFAVRAHGWH